MESGRIEPMGSMDLPRTDVWPIRSRAHSAPSPLAQLAVRVGAALSLCVVAVVVVVELTELRGELAFARFLQDRQLAGKCAGSENFKGVVEEGFAEVDLVMDFARGNPDALTEVSSACLEWAGKKELDPEICLRLADEAVQAAMLAVYAAPSDYECWLRLAYAQSVLGLKEQAEICLNRAQELAPPGKLLRTF